MKKMKKKKKKKKKKQKKEEEEEEEEEDDDDEEEEEEEDEEEEVEEGGGGEGTLNTCKSHVWVHDNLMTMDPQHSQQFGLLQNGNRFFFFSITGKHILK